MSEFSSQPPDRKSVGQANEPIFGRRISKDTGFSELLNDPESLTAPKPTIGSETHTFFTIHRDVLPHGISEITSWKDETSNTVNVLLLDARDAKQFFAFTWQFIHIRGSEVVIDQVYADQLAENGRRIHWAEGGVKTNEILSSDETREIGDEILKTYNGDDFMSRVHKMRVGEVELDGGRVKRVFPAAKLWPTE